MNKYFFDDAIVSKSLLIVLGTLSKARHKLTVRNADERKLKCISARRKPHFSPSLYCIGNVPAKLLDVILIQQRGRCGRRNNFMVVVMLAHITRSSIPVNIVNRSALSCPPRIDREKVQLDLLFKNNFKNNLVDMFALLTVLALQSKFACNVVRWLRCRNSAGVRTRPHIPLACFFGIFLSLFISALFYCTVRRFALVKAHVFIRLPAIVIRQKPKHFLPALMMSLDNSCPPHRYFFKRGKKPALPNGDDFRSCGTVQISLCDFLLHGESPHDKMRVNLIDAKG